MICGYTLYHYPDNGFKFAVATKKDRYKLTVGLFREKEQLNTWIFDDDSEGKMSIFIRGLDGKTFTIYVDQHYLIDDVKNIIDNACGLHSSDQRLVYNGKVLLNSYMVKDYSITPGSTIHLVMSLRGC